MRTCPNDRCGAQVPLDSDWCPACGTYARWEPTGTTPSLPEGPGDGPLAGPTGTPLMTPTVPREPARIGLLDADGEWLANPALRVQPGERLSVRVHIRNQSGITDTFQVRLDGLPEGWWSVAPAALDLNPYGSTGAEGELTVTLHPPRDASARAGHRALRFTALAGKQRTPLAHVDATLEIGRLDEVRASLAPQRRSGRRRARYRVRVENHGNALAVVGLAASDDGERLRLRLQAPRLELDGAAGGETTLLVRPLRPRLLGAPVDHRITVTLAAPGGPVAPLTATFTQRAWLPRWLPLAVPPVALLVAAALTLPARVPDVRGTPVDEAKRALDASHLGWKPPEVRQSEQPVGTVLETIPAPGSLRLRGSQVTLIIATNSHRARVPDVVGATYKDAVVKLVNAGFEAGDPAPDDLEAKVREQIPKAGARWPRDRPVQLRFADPEPSATPTHRRVRVPAVAGGSLAAAQTALAEAGLKTRVTHVIDVEPAGTVLAGEPKKGTLAPGSVVELTVSAGFPALAYDDGRVIRLADGRDGTHRRRLELAGGGAQTQPAWSPDGAQLAYRSGDEDGGRIWVAPAAPTPRGGRPLTERGHDDRRPAFSPDGKVVAFVRGDERAAAHELCFVRVSGSKPQCFKRAGIGVSRPVWSADGTAILVRADDGRLLRLTTKRPSSARATDWRRAGTVPVQRLGAVLSVAWSKTGALALAVASRDPEAPTLYAAKSDDGPFQPLPYGGIACEVAWRADGGELVVAGRGDRKGNPCPDGMGDRGAAARMPADGADSVDLGDGIIDPAFRPL